MFQTGYLTIKEYHMQNQTYILDYPNKEVRDSFLLYALKSYTSGKKSLSNKAVNNLIFYIESNHIEKFILELKALFSSIPVQEVKQIYQYEAYYHSVIYVALRLMGCSIDCEVQSNHGITDAVIKTEENIYIIEFKMGRAKEALKQIKEKKYYFPYLSDKRKKHLFGIGFDKGERNIGDWEIEIIGERMEEMNKVVSFESEKLILVDEDDTVVGYETKDKCHNGDGILHRAFSIFIFNSEGKLLLQKRAATKRLWGQFWSNTCCSHPRKGEDYDIATVRRLEEELGMKTKLKYLYKFQYQAAFKNLGSENELCSVYIGKSDDAPKVNSTEIEEIQYIFAEELDVELEKNPNQFTPWFKMEWKTLRENYWKKIEGLVI
jgi:isopentenyl-diphosphate delta-isomerase